MHLPDLLSRCKEAPDDAWKSMDVIDSQDFDYAPLLALEPAYLFSMSQHYENSEVHSVAQPNGWYTTEPNGSACTLQVHYVAQHECWMLTRVQEHAGSGATQCRW